jgi:hypothetical protein
LVTTLPIDDPEQVRTIVQSYCIRWQIEIYFRTIKSGCRVEERQFETLDRLMNCVAVYSIIAWRIMYLCRLGRECPDLDCEVVLEPSDMEGGLCNGQAHGSAVHTPSLKRNHSDDRINGWIRKSKIH